MAGQDQMSVTGHLVMPFGFFLNTSVLLCQSRAVDHQSQSVLKPELLQICFDFSHFCSLLKLPVASCQSGALKLMDQYTAYTTVQCFLV